MKFASINFRRAIRDFSEYNKLRNRLVNARIVTDSYTLRKNNYSESRRVSGGYSNSKIMDWLTWKPEVDYYCFLCKAEKVKSKLINPSPEREGIVRVPCYQNSFRLKKLLKCQKK